MAVRKVLTDKMLKALKPAPAGRRTEIYDALVPPLMLRATETGHKSFALYVRVRKGPPIRLALGDYGAVTLEAARKKARVWLEQIAAGLDPREEEAREAERRRHEEGRRNAESFAVVLGEFAKRHLTQNRSGSETRRTLERELLPEWSTRPISQISRRDVIAAIDRIVDRGAPIAANRTLAFTKKLFSWAVEHGYIDSSPAVLVKRPAREVKRDRVLTDQEVAAIWRACGSLGRTEADGREPREDGLVHPFGGALRFLLATACRRDEAADLRWRELDLDRKMWTLPRERSKGDRAQEIPLNRLALSILESVPHFVGADAFVFTTRGDRPLGGWSTAKARIDERSGVSGWRIHDLRRTAATSMARLGVDRLVISKVLGHAESGVTSIYDRFGYEPEKRQALERWAAHIERVIAPAPAADVVVALHPVAG